MNKRLLLILTLSILAIMIASCTASPSSNQQLRTLYVSATGKVDLEPDIATVNIGVKSQSTQADEAFEQNNADVQAIIQTMVDMGIDRSDIQTRSFNIYQQQETTRPMLDEESLAESSQTVFVVENTVSVTVREIDLLGEVLTAVVGQGANTIYGVVFDIEDKEAATVQARQIAIQDAQEKAQAMAEEAGVKLGEIHSIEINQNNLLPREEPAAVDMAVGGVGIVPISEGTMSINVTVYLVYRIN